METSSTKQVYLTTLMTAKISEGPSLTVSAYVPDLHHSGKLWRKRRHPALP